jgi:AhpD family alkylhydroperoxidase
MARIEGVSRDRAGVLTKLAYRQAEKQLGEVPEPFAIAAHHTKLALGYGAFEMAVERADSVDEKLKMLAAMKAALLVGCEWCIDIGAMLSYRAGISERQMRELMSYRDSDAFSPLEKLVIEYAECMTRTPVNVPDELFAKLREHFDEKQIVELTTEIAIENYRARFNWALGIQPQGFTRDGDFCPLPSGEPTAA